MNCDWKRPLAALALAFLALSLTLGCVPPAPRPEGGPEERPHGDEMGRIPRGGTGLADGSLPPGGDRCTAAVIGRNGNPNLTGIVIGNVAYIAAGNLPGTNATGMGPYDGSGEDTSTTLTATGGAQEGNGPPNALNIMVDTVRQNCPQLAHIRIANDAATASRIASLASDVSQGRSIADRMGEVADLDRQTHIAGAGVTGSGSGGARGGQTGSGLPNAGGAGP